MHSSIPSKKCRLIPDYFAPAPAPIRSTTSFADADDTDSEWITDNVDNQVVSAIIDSQSDPVSLKRDSSSDLPQSSRARGKRFQ